MKSDTSNRFAYIETRLQWGDGLTARELAETFRLTRQTAQGLIDEYRRRYPGNLHFDPSFKKQLPGESSFPPVTYRRMPDISWTICGATSWWAITWTSPNGASFHSSTWTGLRGPS